jgi:hypothetical protein
MGDSVRLIRTRLGQVTYTLTQFSTVSSVRFRVEGKALTSIPGPPWAASYSRASFRSALLPAIFVDRPAWGAGLPDGLRVIGQANVFEAQFRIALIASNGRVLIDRPVHATAGSGTWGTFSVALDYAVTKAQWGTLRVYDPSERDGAPESIREYPVYLRP